MSHPESARDFLAIHLPVVLREVCDLATLQLAPGSFLEDDLRPYCSDVLYSLDTAAGDGYVYCLIEHQSTADRHMAFRLMRYAIAAMQQHLAAGHEQLPLAIPLLFYHGERSPYPYAMNWLQGFDDPALAGQLYGNAFPLIDITVTPDDEILQHRRVALLELLQKHIRNRDLAELVEQIVTLLMAGYTDGSQLQALLNYMLQAGETRAPAELLATLASRVPAQGDTLMTIAEQLKAEGEQHGILKGRQEGRQEGALQVARNLVAQTSMDDTTIAGVAGLDIEQVRQIRREAGQ